MESIQRYWKRTDKMYLLLCLFSSAMAVLALSSWAAKQGSGFAVDELTDNYSWYKLGGFTFQPTELAKISFILTFAMHLNNVRSRLNEPKELGKLLLHLFVPIGIIHIQGDDGTAIIYGIIGCCMLFAAGLSWKYIIGAFSALAAAAAVAFAFFSDKIGKGYQWYRILAVIDPNNAWCWACCWPSSSRPSPPERAARICWAPSSAPASAARSWPRYSSTSA